MKLSSNRRFIASRSGSMPSKGSQRVIAMSTPPSEVMIHHCYAHPRVKMASVSRKGRVRRMLGSANDGSDQPLRSTGSYAGCSERPAESWRLRADSSGGDMHYGVFNLPATYPEIQTASVPFYDNLRAQVRAAEELGYESFWFGEHHFHGFGGMLPSPPVVIAGLAAETRRLRFGTGVALVPFHHPLLTAEDYATADVLTGGRLDFGVGLGFQRLEFDNLGVALDTARARFQEYLEVILRAWTGDELHYDGQFGSWHAPVVLPRPVQRPHPPVWVAATATPESFN